MKYISFVVINQLDCKDKRTFLALLNKVSLPSFNWYSTLFSNKDWSSSSPSFWHKLRCGFSQTTRVLIQEGSAEKESFGPSLYCVLQMVQPTKKNDPSLKVVTTPLIYSTSRAFEVIVKVFPFRGLPWRWVFSFSWQVRTRRSPVKISLIISLYYQIINSNYTTRNKQLSLGFSKCCLLMFIWVI